MRLSGFDWDDGNRNKCQKDGVSIGEIEDVLTGTSRVAPDRAHSGTEDRLIAIGRTQEGRAVFVAFTFRHKGGKRVIRPISARYMHSKERLAYDKNRSENDDR